MKCTADGAVAQGTGAVTPTICPAPPADPAVVAAAEGYARFNHIKTEDLGKLLGCLSAQVRALDADEFIMNNRESKPLVGVVLTGQVAMISEDMFGKRSILTLLPPDNVFGETWSLLRLRNRTISFRAAEKSTVLLLDYGHIFHECNLLCRYHHRMVENMVEIIAGANLELIEKLEVSTRLTIREKLLTYLVREAQRSRSTTFTIPMSQTELADYIGADRTAMLRELTNMKKDGLIDYSRRTFTLYYQG